MNNFFLIISCILVLISGKTLGQDKKTVSKLDYHSVKIDTLFQDVISIRAITVDKDKVWYAGNNSRFGFYDLKTNSKTENKIPKDSLEFRSIAQNTANLFLLNVANPALLYKINKKDMTINLVYQEKHEKVFYDSMKFWNDQEGIAMGDPITNCLSVIVTRDGGETWSKISCDNLPKVDDGEAAFAASNTNVIIKGENTWIVTGGKKANVFYSKDKAKTWQRYPTPIVQGKAMTGIFTADFYDVKNGFVAGGDYENLNQNHGNKAVTEDGGKTWRLIAENNGFGYASCVQYVPGSNGKALVTVGASGIYFSSNGGASWRQLASDPNLYTIRFMNPHTAIAAGKNKMIRLQFSK